MGRRPIETIEAGKILKSRRRKTGNLNISAGDKLTVREELYFYKLWMCASLANKFVLIVNICLLWVKRFDRLADVFRSPLLMLTPS
jgi:hypothetical protein